MPRTSIPAVAGLLVGIALHLSTGWAVAGPVQLELVDRARAASSAQALAPAPSRSTAADLSLAPRTDAPAAESADAQDPAQLGSTTAAEIIKEAGAESPKPEAGRDAYSRGPSGQSAGRSKPARPAEDEWNLQEFGKAAVRWFKGIVPWLKSEDEALDAPRHPSGGISMSGTEALIAMQLAGAERATGADPAKGATWGRGRRPPCTTRIPCGCSWASCATCWNIR